MGASSLGGSVRILHAMVRPPPRLALTLTLLLSSALPAQDPTAASKREATLTAFAIENLHEFADAYEADKQHGTARELRREILLEYDEEDEKARHKLGFAKVGNMWQLDPTRLVIDKDLTGTKKVLRRLARDVERFRKKQLDQHRDVAKLWTRAGDTGRAARHWRRVLALAPDDEKAAEALSLSRFQGFRGDAAELHRLRRAWAIRGAVEWLHRHEFPVEKIEKEQHPLLEKAGIEHVGYRTESFDVWGVLPGDQLEQVAAHCERALALCRTVFGVSQGFPFEPRGYRPMVMVASDEAYAQVLDQCADQFTPERLHFLKNDVDLAFLAVGNQQVRFIKTNGSDDEAFDQSVRGAFQDAIGVTTDGLWEGVGHAGCGLLFGKTITFLLEQQDARTVASWAQQMLVPDMEAWMKIAEQSAWARSDTRTSELVLITAARFSTEQRVKAWAICDWFFHWRPELIWQLDQSRTEFAKTPPDVEAQFEKLSGIPLPRIDMEWRDFWARQGDLRAAMRADPLGEPKGRDRKLRTEARELVDAVNAQRTAARRGPLGFYFAEGVDVAAALHYADKLVKAEKDQRRNPKKEVPMPEPPAAIGTTVLFSRQETAAAAVADWQRHPAWRDAMLHPGRGLLGANKNKNCFVLDLTEPVQATTRGKPLTWPRHGQDGVPGSVRVGDLGPRAVAALSAKGKTADDVVATPWTLHFHRDVPADDLRDLHATVYVNGRPADGVLIHYQDDDGVRADGCVAFLGLEPPKPGEEVEVNWTVPVTVLRGDEKFEPVVFYVE